MCAWKLHTAVGVVRPLKPPGAAGGRSEKEEEEEVKRSGCREGAPLKPLKWAITWAKGIAFGSRFE